MINFYTRMDKKHLPKIHNPAFSQHHITVPFRMVISGPSSSMKTNTAFNIIYAMPNTFCRIVVITKNRHEPLYDFLMEKIPSLEIYEGLEHAPLLDSFDKTINTLVIFDDLCLDKSQGAVEAYAIRCRKLNVSMMYLTQSWFKTPDTLRKNLTHICLKKVAKTDELNRILRDYSLGMDKDELAAAYRHAIRPTDPDDPHDKVNFLFLDLEADTDSIWKVRRNLTPISHTY